MGRILARYRVVANSELSPRKKPAAVWRMLVEQSKGCRVQREKPALQSLLVSKRNATAKDATDGDAAQPLQKTQRLRHPQIQGQRRLQTSLSAAHLEECVHS